MTRAAVFAATLVSLAASLALPAFSQDAAAPDKPDLAKGQAIASQVCGACHGPDGNGVSNQFPKLAGQHAEYLVKQLKNFKSGDRANAIMGPYAAALSDADMINLAAYFEQQVEKPALAHDKTTVDLGQKLYRGGVADRGVPACASCHGPTGAGIPVQYPHLAGQWEEYVEAQLTAFKGGVRKNNAAMTTIAGRMTDGEIKAVADYIAGLR